MSTERKGLIAALVIAAVLILASIGINVYDSYRDKEELSDKYDHAIELIEAGKYESAWSDLLDFRENPYKSSDGLREYAYARMCYDEGEIGDAYYAMEHCRVTEASDRLKSEIHAFRTKVNGEIDAFRAKRETEEKREYENRISTGVPYVGMSESSISDTSLGKPSSNVRHNSDVIDGEHKTANLYDFINSSGMMIFSARCIDGRVVGVWDFRDSPRKPYSESSNNSSPTQKDDDPYNAKEYNDVDSFYDDYYGDFADFDEAEQYYEEHN